MGYLQTLDLADWLGVGGFVLAILALFLNWRQHRYQVSKDKVRFIAEIKFTHWYTQAPPLDPDAMYLDTLDRTAFGFMISLRNQGVAFRPLQYSLKTWPVWPGFYAVFPRVFQSYRRDILEVGDSLPLEGEVTYADYFGRSARIRVETKGGEVIFARLKGWKKARRDFLKWKAKHESTDSE